MPRVILKTILFSFLILASAAAINWIVIPNNPAAYQAAKLDKLAMLERTESPKIVLIGGSNLAFSIDSGLLSNEFGMPVVNMGLAKSVGMQYLLEESKPFIREDDIVILAFEYEMFYDLYYGTDGLIVELQYVPSGFKNLKTWGQFRTFASKFGPIMQAKFTGFIRTGTAGLVDDVYRRDGFDDYGDLVTHLDKEPAYTKHELFENDEPFHEESIKLLNDFYQDMLRIGARVVLAAPPLVETEFKTHQDKIEGLFVRLREDLSIPVISDPADYVYPLRMMFDTAYHTLREGRRLRTYRLLNDLMITDGIGYGGRRGDQV
ncbi:MAG: hypothetical protein ACC655_09610 [Rhodothermia bacterium]